MIEKYVIHLSEGGIVAIKFDILKKQVTVGGRSRFRRWMESIVQDYFQLPISEMKWTQRNKVRYIMFCTKKKFDTAIDLLQEHGVVVKSVTSLERIMR